MIYTTEQIGRIVEPIAKRYGLPAVYLFGSYARGTATEDSDIDFLVDTTGTALKSLFALGGLYNDFEEAFDKQIDMVTVGALTEDNGRRSRAMFRENVMKDRVRIYAVS